MLGKTHYEHVARALVPSELKRSGLQRASHHNACSPAVLVASVHSGHRPLGVGHSTWQSQRALIFYSFDQGFQTAQSLRARAEGSVPPACANVRQRPPPPLPPKGRSRDPRMSTAENPASGRR